MLYFWVVMCIFLFLYTHSDSGRHSHSVLNAQDHNGYKALQAALSLFQNAEESYCQNHLFKVNADVKADSQNVEMVLMSFF